MYKFVTRDFLMVVYCLECSKQKTKPPAVKALKLAISYAGASELEFLNTVVFANLSQYLDRLPAGRVTESHYVFVNEVISCIQNKRQQLLNHANPKTITTED